MRVTRVFVDAPLAAGAKFALPEGVQARVMLNDVQALVPHLERIEQLVAAHA